MALNLFRRKQKSGTARPKTVVPASDIVSQEAARSGKDAEPKDGKREIPLLATKVHRTEKATQLGMLNHYVFQIDRSTNKREFRKAVERHYEVHVEKVRIMNATGKKRRVKGILGWRPGYKKAIVTVRQGEKIDVGV